jgi:hypothetical protein
MTTRENLLTISTKIGWSWTPNPHRSAVTFEYDKHGKRFRLDVDFDEGGKIISAVITSGKTDYLVSHREATIVRVMESLANDLDLVDLVEIGLI